MCEVDELQKFIFCVCFFSELDISQIPKYLQKRIRNYFFAQIKKNNLRVVSET